MLTMKRRLVLLVNCSNTVPPD